MKNKKGWIEIVEAFTSILLIAGVLIVIAGSLRIETQNFSAQVYDSEYAILREIQLDNSLRDEIIAMALPVEWDDLGNVKIKVEDKTPPHLDCVAKLCGISDVCVSNLPPSGEDIFVQSVFISANLDNYSPRKLNLFCWSK